ncbi:MAG: hypothetical protein HUU10_12095 [Bacteroidetes bacterium]|nr:hypothetical protein [Bacteroidota bacterium]
MKYLTGSLVVLLLLTGCDWFDLRDPEEPSQRRSSFQEPFQPEFVLDNLRFAFSEANPENFRKCLGSDGDYQFIPSPEFQSSIPPLTREDEIVVFTNQMRDLLPQETMTVTFINAAFQPTQIDSVEWVADYRLFIPRSSTDYPSNIDGKMVLNLRKSPEGLWYIYRWRDFSVLNNFCWSQLKLRFMQ